MSEKTGPVEVHNPVTQQGSTFAERKKAREAGTKQVVADEVEDKAVKSSESKRTSKKS